MIERYGDEGDRTLYSRYQSVAPAPAGIPSLKDLRGAGLTLAPRFLEMYRLNADCQYLKRLAKDLLHKWIF